MTRTSATLATKDGRATIPAAPAPESPLSVRGLTVSYGEKTRCLFG